MSHSSIACHQRRTDEAVPARGMIRKRCLFRETGGLYGARWQASPRIFDIGVGRAVASCVGFSGPHSVFRDVEANNGAGHPMIAALLITGAGISRHGD